MGRGGTRKTRFVALVAKYFIEADEARAIYKNL